MAATDANPIAIKGAAYRATFFIMDGSGAPVTGAAGLDSERSLDAAAFADCTNEATEIGRGAYYLDLTAAEMTADTVAITVQTSTAGAKPTLLVIYPADRGFNDLAFPTTSGRSIDVAATGEVGLDFSNVNGTLDAAETTGIATSAALAAVQADTDDIQTRLPAALVGGRMDSSVGAMAAAVLTAAAISLDTGLKIRNGTAQAGAGSTITLDAGALATDSVYVGDAIVITGGTGVSQHRIITAYVGATKVATVGEAWGINPDNTSTFMLLPGRAFVSSVLAAAVTIIQAGLATSAALAAVQADTDDIQTRLPAALVGGRMDSSTGAMAANVMTAAAAAPDLTTELQAGLATAASVTAVQADTDDIQTRLPAALVGGKIDASVGAMAANVMTAAAADPSLTTELQAGLATTGDVAALAGGIAAVQADTDNLQTRVPAALVGGRMDSSVGAMAAGTITAAAAAADFDAEVGAAAAAAVALLTSAELAAIPGVGGTMQQKIDFIFEMMRHKIKQTGALQTIFKDDGVTPLGTSITTDDDVMGEFIRGEFV